MLAFIITCVLATIPHLANAEFECYVPRDIISEIVPLHQVAESHLSTMNNLELDEDWKLNDFFGVIQVINDASSVKKLESIASELESVGVYDYEIFPAVAGFSLDPLIQTKCEGQSPVEAGRYMTHYRLLKQVKRKFEQAVLDYYTAQVKHDEKGIKKAKANLHQNRSVLILKDTIGFGTNKSTGTKGLGRVLRETLRGLPENWDIVYFYATTYQPTEIISSLIERINKSYFDVAYAVNYRMYGPLCHHLKKIEEPTIPDVRHIDHQISHIHKDFNVYLMRVPMVYLKD